jgi:GT2 family glycosyltransferase
MSPVLSIVIPTYKRTASLKKLLDALLHQSLQTMEIIVVDQNQDGFFDQSMHDTLQKTKWIKQDQPNASRARNLGFLSSVAEHVLFIDDDLVPETDFCRQGLETFLKYPAIRSFVPLVFTEEGEAAAAASARLKFRSFLPDSNEIYAITDTISAAVFFTRSYFVESGGFDGLLFEFAKTAEDQEFFLRMLKKGMTVWFVPFVKVYHDEGVPGGCDLRTADYWITREKCMKAWALRYRTGSTSGKISARDFFRLFRSCVLNREVLTSSPVYIAKQFVLMKAAIRQSARFFSENRIDYLRKIQNGFIY